jgi:GNAT superfamily N-acetyltransferase
MEVDLPAIAWSGGPGHLESVARYLARAASGEVDYLAVRTPDGRIVAKGGIDYAEHPGYGTMLQLAANPTGHGYGTLLVQAMEERIRARGVDAMLAAESNNPGAHRLNKRLGYTECGHRSRLLGDHRRWRPPRHVSHDLDAAAQAAVLTNPPRAVAGVTLRACFLPLTDCWGVVSADGRGQIQPCSQARWAAACRELTPSLDMAADR